MWSCPCDYNGMAITSINIVNFRNIASAEMELCQQGFNIIHGQNGSGKTSLLEAIHYLGLGRSFRSSSASRLIRQNQSKFSLFAQFMSGADRNIPLGVEREISGATRARMDEKELGSMVELASFLPVRVINSHSHYLFESGPVFRRKFLDWGLFYQYDNFLPSWRQFVRVLRQRNTILREKRTIKELEGWTNELVRYGLELDHLRREYLCILMPIINELAGELLHLSNLQIIYKPGWDESADYPSALASSYRDEFRLGHTQFGPHRADLDILVDGVPVKHILSRGQQKLLICAIILAQGISLKRYANKAVIYLVDDLPSELDLQSRQKLMALFLKQQAQMFITAIEKEMVCDLITDPRAKMKVFHVEQGRVNEIGV